MALDLIESETVDRPGFYRMSAAAYHADPCPEPSLSSSVARVLLNRSPAHAWAMHPQLNPERPAEDAPSRPKEIGTAAHKLVLGLGRDIVVIDGEGYRTKDAREERAAAYAAGHAPILSADMREVEATAARFAEQLALFGRTEEFDAGESEVVLAWQESGGFWCRAMLDKLHVEERRGWLFDYKATSSSADHYAVVRRAFDMGYDVQVAFYRRGLATLLPEAVTDVTAILLTQEASAPYALSAVRFGHEAGQSADKEVWKALALWERCLAGDAWPAYPPIVATADLPPYVEQRRTERELNDRLIAGLDLGPFATTDAPNIPENILAAG